VPLLEEAAKELETEATSLRKTIECNREDVFGMKMRAHGVKLKSDRIAQISARLEELHDLKYLLPG